MSQATALIRNIITFMFMAINKQACLQTSHNNINLYRNRFW